MPFPQSGAYGHWACQRPLWHLGPHRYTNYTISRPALVRAGLRYAYHWLRYRLLYKRRTPWKGRPLYHPRAVYAPNDTLPVAARGLHSSVQERLRAMR